MTKYLTVVLKVADNAENNLVFDQMDRVNGATLSVASWSHVMDERDRYRALLAELVAMVRGECPGLLNEDSGGDANLSVAIDEALSA